MCCLLFCIVFLDLFGYRVRSIFQINGFPYLGIRISLDIGISTDGGSCFLIFPGGIQCGVSLLCAYLLQLFL